MRPRVYARFKFPANNREPRWSREREIGKAANQPNFHFFIEARGIHEPDLGGNFFQIAKDDMNRERDVRVYVIFWKVEIISSNCV